MPTYEIRRSGQVLCSSTLPDCGYPKDILRDMTRAGLHLYCDGKKVKSRLRTDTPDGGKGK